MTKPMAPDDPRRKIRTRLRGRKQGVVRLEEQESRAVMPADIRRAGLEAADAWRKERFKELYPKNKWRQGITCKQLGMSNHRLYMWLAEDQEFAQWWQDQQVLKVESLEEEFDAVVENEHGMPAIVGRIFRLKGEAPHKYREHGAYVQPGRMQVELVFKPKVVEGEYRGLPAAAEEDQATE